MVVSGDGLETVEFSELTEGSTLLGKRRRRRRRGFQPRNPRSSEIQLRLPCDSVSSLRSTFWGSTSIASINYFPLKYIY